MAINKEKEEIIFLLDGKPFKVPPGGSLGLLAQGSKGVRAWKQAQKTWKDQQKKKDE